VDLGYKREAFVTSLSRGMTQRLGLARVLLHDPQVLLLDEPASGLDPRARIEIRNLLKQLGGMGKTIMVSSHILPELADVCNKIGIIERGELLVNNDVATVMQQVKGQTILLIAVKDNLDAAASLLQQAGEVESIERIDSHLRVTLTPGDHDVSQLAKRLIDNGHALTRLAEEEINLETAFMKLTQGITS
jgi:ABC-2 type transport system ATP-binding protein